MWPQNGVVVDLCYSSCNEAESCERNSFTVKLDVKIILSAQLCWLKYLAVYTLNLVSVCFSVSSSFNFFVEDFTLLFLYFFSNTYLGQ